MGRAAMWINADSFTSDLNGPARDLAAVKAGLRQEISRLERSGRALERTVTSSGCLALDAALPWRGLPLGGLHVIQGRSGDGAAFGFAGVLAGRLRTRNQTENGVVVWVQYGREPQDSGVPYGPGLGPIGLSPQGLVLIKARRAVDLLWSMEEALRCPDLAVVIGEGVTPSLTAARRLQLAAEAGSTTALLISPPNQTPTATALTCWRVSAVPAANSARPPRYPAWNVELMRCRGGKPGHWRMEWQHETLHIDLAAPLVHGPLAATG